MINVQTKELLHHFTDAHTGKNNALIYLILFTGDVLSLALSGDDKLMFSGSKDRSIKIFDIETKQQLHQFENLHMGTLTSVSTVFSYIIVF